MQGRNLGLGPNNTEGKPLFVSQHRARDRLAMATFRNGTRQIRSTVEGNTSYCEGLNNCEGNLSGPSSTVRDTQQLGLGGHFTVSHSVSMQTRETVVGRQPREQLHEKNSDAINICITSFVNRTPKRNSPCRVCTMSFRRSSPLGNGGWVHRTQLAST